MAAVQPVEARSLIMLDALKIKRALAPLLAIAWKNCCSSNA